MNTFYLEILGVVCIVAIFQSFKLKFFTAVYAHPLRERIKRNVKPNSYKSLTNYTMRKLYSIPILTVLLLTGHLILAQMPLSVNITFSTNNMCYGDSAGSAQAMASGGLSPYKYQWNDPKSQTTSNAVGLPAGTFVITVTDAQNTTATDTVIITQPAAIAIEVSTTSSSLCGPCNGTATASASGGKSPYSYSWDDPKNQKMAKATGLCPGTYHVTVTDASLCKKTMEVTITSNTGSGMSLSTTINDATCGNTNGSATVKISGGSFPYTYQWNDPLKQTASTATNLAVGTYKVIVKDANGCSDSASATIKNVGGPTAAITDSSMVTCQGLANGDATVTATGGTTPYSFQWNDVLKQTTATADSLPVGNYTVVVTDANGCIAKDSLMINEPIGLSASINGTNPKCSQSCDGSAEAMVRGGTSPYSYLWNDPMFQTSAIASNLCADTFLVGITDANGCKTSASVALAQPSGMVLQFSKTDATCGQADGNATVMVSGGAGSYTYLWNDPNKQTTDKALNLAAGGYSVAVKDANGCNATGNVNINNLSGPSAVISSSTNVLCNGGKDGSATVSASGGVTPYTYLWNDPAAQTSAKATGLSAGSYSVTVNDANKCASSVSVVITEPKLLNASVTSHTNVSCHGGSNGSASVSVSGGVSPYSYIWNDPKKQTTSKAIDLLAGTYNIGVKDANGCSVSAGVTITEPMALTVQVTGKDPICKNGCDGSASATVSGGTPKYSYKWDDAASQTSSSAFNLCPGTYKVDITDGNGCLASGKITINNPAGMALKTSSTDATCGNINGSATVEAIGGKTPYAYLWNDSKAQTTATAGSLAGGEYMVEVSDANSCKEFANAIVNNLNGPIPTVTSTMVSCFGGNNGSASATVSGGNTPYTYLWDDKAGQTTATASNLTAASYTVTVTDSLGCVGLASVKVEEPAALSLSTSTIETTCLDCSDGSASVLVSGGVVSYTYLWNDAAAQTTSTANNLKVGIYSVTVKDGNGCTATATDTVKSPNLTEVSGDLNWKGLAIYPNPSSSNFYVDFTKSTADPSELLIYNNMGRVVFEKTVSGIGKIQENVFTEEWVPGLYMVKLKDSQYQIIKQILIIK